MIKSNGIAAKLDAYEKEVRQGRVLAVLSDQPEALLAIKKARVERKVPLRYIAKVIAEETGERISEHAVRNWLDQEGIA